VSGAALTRPDNQGVFRKTPSGHAMRLLQDIARNPHEHQFELERLRMHHAVTLPYNRVKAVSGVDVSVPRRHHHLKVLFIGCASSAQLNRCSFCVPNSLQQSIQHRADSSKYQKQPTELSISTER
jgi:hypothetical protein